MAQIDGSTPDAEASSSRTPRVVLPPPPIAGLRNLARVRGAFDESLPTLRLPSLPPRAEGLLDDDEPGHTDAPAPRGVIDVRGLRPVTGRPVSPRAVLLTGPQLVAPVDRTLVGTRRRAGIPASASRLIDQLEDPEEIDDGDGLDDAFERSPTISLRAAPTLPEGDAPDDTLPAGDAPGDTMPGLERPELDAGATFGGASTSMHARTLVDGDRTELAWNDPAWSAHGAPLVAIPHDPTPVVNVPVLAVPPPAVLVHAIVAPARPARPRRRWWLAALVPAAIAVLGLGVWALEPADVMPQLGASVPALEPVLQPAVPDVLPELRVQPAGEPSPAAVLPPPVVPPTSVPANAVALAGPIDEPVIEVEPELEETDAPPIVDAAPPVAAPVGTAKSKAKKKKTQSKARKRSAKPQSIAPAPKAPVAAASPVTVRPPGASAGDATALLREAERAFAEGRYATALHFADRSRAKKADPRAARIAALSACRIGNARKAKAALAGVPAAQRSSVTKTCRDRGIDL